MSNLNDFNNLFAPKIETPVQQKELIEWRPSFRNAPNKLYKAIIRFVPFWQDPSNSIIEKFSCFLENPYQPNSGRTVDSPSSVGEKDPISETYWMLKNSGNAINVENAKKFSRTVKYSMLVQIISDQVNPKLNGSILVWRVGKKVYDKIANEMRPIMEGIQPRNPFDIIHGRAFLVTIAEASGFNNYDQCQFVDLPVEQSALKIYNKTDDGTWTPVEVVNENSDKQKVFDYLKTCSPDLNKFKYQPWDEETAKYVDSVIAFYTGRTSTGAAPQPIASPQRTASLESIIGNVGSPSPVNVQSSAPVVQSAPAMPTTPPAGLNLDSVLSSPIPTAAPTGGNITGIDMSDLASVMPGVSSAPAAQEGSAMSAPLDLNDILKSAIG